MFFCCCCCFVIVVFIVCFYMKSFSYKLKAFYWPLVDAIVVHFDTWCDIFHFGFLGRILVLIGQIPGHCLAFSF